MKISKVVPLLGIIAIGASLFFLLCCVIYFAKRPILMPSGTKLPVVFYNTPRTSSDEQGGIYPHIFFPKEDGTSIDGSSLSLSGNPIRFIFRAKSDGLQKIVFFTTGHSRGRPFEVSASIYKCGDPKSWTGNTDSRHLIQSSSIFVPASVGLQQNIFSFPRQNSSYGELFAVDFSSSEKIAPEICIKKAGEENREYYVDGHSVAGGIYFWDEYGRKRFSLKERPVLLGSPEFVVQHAFSKLDPEVEFVRRLPMIISRNFSRICFVVFLLTGALAAPLLIWRLAIWRMTALKQAAGGSRVVQVLPFFLKRAFFVGPFLCIVYWFSIHDIWNTNIAYPNSVYSMHTVLRTVFIFYFSWIIYSVGAYMVRLFEKRGGKLDLSYVDRTIVSFFTGAAGLQMLLFGMGYLGTYYRSVAFLFGAAILALSYNHFRSFIAEGVGEISEAVKKTENYEKSICYFLGAGIVFFGAILFFVIGMYTNDGDYITHYGNFYDQVIRSHGIWPNGWWYQYFYSKGAGLFFFSMLLTDKMSPPIVSYIFIVASCLIMFSLTRKVSKGIIWPMLAVFYYLAILIDNYTIPYRMHVVSGVMLIAMAWMLSVARYNNVKANRTWGIAGAFIIAGLVIVAPTISIYAFAILGVYFSGSVLKRQWRQVKVYAVWIASGGTFLATILTINFFTTGLFEGTPFRLWLGFWDQTRSASWVSPYMLFYVSELIGPDMGRIIMPGQISSSTSMSYMLGEALRLNYITPLFLKCLLVPGIVALAVIAIKKRVDFTTYLQAIFLPSFIVLAFVVLSLLSVNQTTSLIRSVGFSGFFLVLCIFLLGYLAFQGWGRKTLTLFILWVTLVSCFSVAGPLWHLKNRIDYMIGAKSMWDAMDAEGNIYRPIADMRKEIGMDAQVAYLQINGNLGQSYLIGRGLLNPISYSYWDKWHILAFEDPAKAMAAFKEMSIDYFLIDFSARSYDLIAYSQLFEVANMKKYFSVRWSSEPFYLLTWRGSEDAGPSLSDEFLKRWAAEQRRPDHFGARAYERLKLIYKYNNGRITGVKVPPNLPPLEKSIDSGVLIYKRA